MVGLGRVVLSRREHVAMIEPFDKGLLATTLRYATEVRDQGAYFEDIPDLNLPAEMRELAAHIVETKAGHFEPKKFKDHYETALVELLRQKQAGQPVEPIGEEKQPVRVINLMDALRASLKGEEEKKPAAASIETRRAATKKKTSR
jgi:DNA end-binding protein Ku